MATTIKTGPLHQDKALLADFAEAVSPFFVGGGIISREFVVGKGDYLEADDELILEIAGATEISFCEFQTAVGVKIAHVVSDLSGTAGKVITIDPGSEALVRCFIIYKV